MRLHSTFPLLLAAISCCQAIIRVPLTKEKDPDFYPALRNIVQASILKSGSGSKADTPYPEEVLKKNNYQYFGEIQVGEPGQKFNVAFGTSFYNILVPSHTASYSCANGHNTFFEENSKTFNRTGPQVRSAGPYTLLQPASDTISVGGAYVEKQNFGLILEGDCSGLKYDGILGLGFPVSNKEPTLIASLFAARRIPRYMVSLRLNRDQSKKEGGEVIFGGYDEKLVKSASIRYIPALQYSMWSLNVDRISFGTREIGKMESAILDSSVSYIGVPKRYIETIRNATNAIILNSTLLVDKHSVKHFPYLTFVLAGESYTLEPTDYVDSVHEFNGLAYVLLKPIETDQWVLGNAFLGKYLTILDYEQRRVAFATINSASSMKQSWLFGLIVLLSSKSILSSLF